MSHLCRASYRFPCATAVMTVLVLFGACTQARAVSGIVGECLDDAFGQTTNCTANEITPTALSVVQVVDGCTGPTDTASLVLEVTVQSSTLAREDVGFFVGLDGDAAQTGASCWHDYLDPPLTATPAYGDANGNTIPDIHNGPWLTSDSDTCGDIAANTEVIKTLGSVLNPVVVACSDTDSNGSLDLSLCATFDHSQALTCDSAAQAIPVVASKCQCFRFETSVPVPPATTTTTTTTTTLPDSCSPTPLAGCQAGDKAKLVMSRPLPDGTRDKLTWKWAKDADVAAADFGDPLSTANYDLCIYEDGVQFTEDIRRIAAARLKKAGIASTLFVSPVHQVLRVPTRVRYDGAVSLGWLNLPFTPAQLRATLRRVRGLLAPGGVFLFDFFEFDDVKVPPTEAVELADGLLYVSHAELLGRVLRRYHVWIRGHREILAESSDLVERTKAQVRRLLADTGFEVVEEKFLKLHYPREFWLARRS